MRYAEEGGSLLILGASGRKDQWNVPLPAIPLARMLGASQYPEQAVRKRWGRGEVRFLPLAIPASRFLIPMKAKGEYTTFGPTMADLFPDIPEGYTRNRMDAGLRKHLEAVVDEALGMLEGRVTRLASPAPFVEITHMAAEDQSRLALHLVNYDVTLDGTLTTVRDLKLEVALPAGRRARTVAYCGDLTTLKSVPFQQLGAGKIGFVADRLDAYGLAIVELERLPERRCNGQEIAAQAGRRGSRDRRRPPRPGLRPGPQLGPLRLGHGAAGRKTASTRVRFRSTRPRKCSPAPRS